LEPDLKIWIDLAELTWLDELYAHAANLFQHNFLPSHDHSHHLRVWNLCKSLLREVNVFCSDMDQSLVEGVMIAAFFHDLVFCT
jgi:HD superfamily phosphodiesterase